MAAGLSERVRRFGCRCRWTLGLWAITGRWAVEQLYLHAALAAHRLESAMLWPFVAVLRLAVRKGVVLPGWLLRLVAFMLDVSPPAQ